jgi:hypothetical protein
MYIFIDEAGGFQQPSKTHAVSCVTALIVPEGCFRTFARKFRTLVRPWRSGAREVKGSQLSEQQMAAVVTLVRRFDVLLLSIAIDMGLHSAAGISAHREAQVAAIRRAITNDMVPTVRSRTDRLAHGVSELSNQLYVQSVLLTKLADAVMRYATLYYVQRLPKTLGRFCWRLDAKDLAITSYEKLWQEIVGPFLQTSGVSQPMHQLKGADYSAFQPFLGVEALPPDHLRPHVRAPNDPFPYVNIDAFLEDLRFCGSHTLTGLQAVDFLASAVRRACNGHLERSGWKGIGRLMPTPERNAHAVRFVALEAFEDRDVPYAAVVREWDRETKRMIL